MYRPVEDPTPTEREVKTRVLVGEVALLADTNSLFSADIMGLVAPPTPVIFFVVEPLF